MSDQGRGSGSGSDKQRRSLIQCPLIVCIDLECGFPGRYYGNKRQLFNWASDSNSHEISQLNSSNYADSVTGFASVGGQGSDM